MTRLINILFVLTFPLVLFPFRANSYCSDTISPKRMLIRIFKHEKELEVWISDSSKFELYKKYDVCMMSGEFGPKRKQGDLQVPEGFYYINNFNPNSKYHLSLGINYPNESDRILSYYKDPGGAIFIHGDCVSVGCIAVGNKSIEEIYNLATKIKSKIEVHIFPINYRYFKSLAYLDQKIKENPFLLEFEKNIFSGYIFFEENEKLPNIKIDEDGKYFFD